MGWRGLLLLGVSLCGGGSTASAGETPWNRVVLVELYTSQGCSSCPAADQLVRDLPRLGLARDKVVPLTFHVSYWDQLGWKDRFASPAFAQRQEWYAGSGRLRAPEGERALAGLYTPQLVVAGMVHLSGQRHQAALAEMRRAALAPAAAELDVEAHPEGDKVQVTVRIKAGPSLDPAADWRLVVALSERGATTQVQRGENRGRTLQEAAIVRVLSDRLPVDRATLAARGAAPLRVTLARPADLGAGNTDVTVFVQSERTREIAAALVLPAAP